MGLIYEPSGRAREYSPLAANFYNGCDHGCRYCYGPNCRYLSLDEYAKNVTPKKNIQHEIDRDSKKHYGCKSQVLFNFIGDPYCKTDEKVGITKYALERFLENKIPVAILSKGGERIYRDMELFKMFGKNIKVGQTVGFSKTESSKEWEPGASLPEERLSVFKELKKNGLKTWASFEPVLDIHQAIETMKKVLPFVDEFKVGKINGRYDKGQDWTFFLETVVDILRKEKKPFYIKHDLRQNAPTVKLYGNEVLPDEHCVQAFQDKEARK